MCDIDANNTIVRKDSFIGLKVALNELSKNFDSLDLSEDDDTSAQEKVIQFADFKLLTSFSNNYY